MIYLASPYSHPDQLVRKTRYLLAMQCCAALINGSRAHVWSPIVHCHIMAEDYDLPTDAEFWKEYGFDFLRRADKMLILAIPGWNESKGVKMEMEFCDAIGLKYAFVNENGFYLP